MMMIAILLSFHGTEKQLQTSQASTAFLIIPISSIFLPSTDQGGSLYFALVPVSAQFPGATVLKFPR